MIRIHSCKTKKNTQKNQVIDQHYMQHSFKLSQVGANVMTLRNVGGHVMRFVRKMSEVRCSFLEETLKRLHEL